LLRDIACFLDFSNKIKMTSTGDTDLSANHPENTNHSVASVPSPSMGQSGAYYQNHMAAHNSTTMAHRPKVTTTLWEDEGTLCFQVEARGVCVARREDNHMVNGTKLLNVAGMTRGKRDGILKTEKVRHVVKVGAMHLKGVWIPFERALNFANREKITELLFPLFVADIKTLLYHPGNPPMLRGPIETTNSNSASSTDSGSVSTDATSNPYSSPIVSRKDEPVQSAPEYLQYQSSTTPSYALYSDGYDQRQPPQHQVPAHHIQNSPVQQLSQTQSQSQLSPQQVSPSLQQQHISQQSQGQPHSAAHHTQAGPPPIYNYDYGNQRVPAVYGYSYQMPQQGQQQPQYAYPPPDAAAYAAFYAKQNQSPVAQPPTTAGYASDYQYYTAGAVPAPPTAPVSRSNSPGHYSTQHHSTQPPVENNLHPQIVADRYGSQYSHDGN
jgi:enhanced filamentous growth protein 1